MTHEMFRLASATPEQLDIVMVGMVVVFVAVGALALWVRLQRKRIGSEPSRAKRNSKVRKRWRSPRPGAR